MKEKDVEISASPRYMSPIVKQDLARLDKDTESRRSAMDSLKHFVENLDPASMPRFLAQVSEIRDQGASKTYAISLYEEVARVHGKLIIPHIPRVMATVTRSLSSSGSSPQLHQACAKVVSAVARYSIDDTSLLQADEILREVCDPLLEELAGKIEPVAAGAAVCLQALVECGKWGNASDEVVNEACLRTTVAMGEKSTRTVAHMQLTCALATANPTIMSAYGVPLLRAGVEILTHIPASASAPASWQQRACAARLLQVVLPIVDRATLSSELGPTIKALDSCKHDRMPHVRTAVSEALKTAKLLLVEDKFRRNGDGEDPLGIPPLNFFSENDKHFKKASRRKSLFAVSEEYMPSPAAPRRASCSPLCFSQVSQESQIVSFPPSMSSESSTSSFVSPSPGRSRRSPLFPTRPQHKCSSQTSSVSSGDTFDGYFHPYRLSEAPAKENVPARNPDVNAGVPYDIGINSGGSPRSGRFGKYVRPRPPTPGSYIPYPPSLSDKLGTDQQSRDIDVSPVVMSKSRQGRSYNAIEESLLATSREQEGYLLTHDEEVFSNGGTTVDIEAESDTSSSRDNIHSVSSRISTQTEQSTISQVKTGRESLGSYSISGSARSRSVLSGPTMKNVFELKRPVNTSATRSSEQPLRTAADEDVIRPADDIPGSDCKETMDALCNLRGHYNSMAHLRSMEEPYSPQKQKALITAEDFLPYSTPRRLVRSLQSTLSSPDSGSGSVGDLDSKSTGEVVDMADMDLETSSEAGWSVRDNPIASDDSFKTDSDEEDSGRNVCKKMTADLSSDTSASPSDDNHVSDACERLTDSVLGLASELTSVNKSSSIKDGRVIKPEEDVEIIKRTQQDGISNSYSQSRGGLRSLLVEDSAYDCSCSGKDHETKQLSGVEAICKDGHDILSPGLFGEKLSGVISGRVGIFISKSWRSVRSYAEVFLGGSLLVVLALPFAMAMSKLFLSRPELPGLVPT
ncbi:hypothetical protein AXG93_2490s1320 [Marchantia polymorpha subsp. ruderalis]|uniref:TORTIFOLIA1/SINE1-2 N-terminal domain-containing protein n=1 Tax=Marchantia polymorpha subsp. ruderalis TaxID=1480154 RepID=A0A176W6V6_MARPO|nr:hypothetical protein AXG93_2490s1320 [Marchantia polymorpha subsp. ruderalis]